MASIIQRSRTYGKSDFGKTEGQRCSIDIGKSMPEELKQVLCRYWLMWRLERFSD
jgi:hypothetical protein